MHNAALDELGLNWRYLAFDVHPDSLHQALAGAKMMKFIGLNLTVPHKLIATPMIDLLDQTALKWGAVNTVRFEGRCGDEWQPMRSCDPQKVEELRSVGFNTDADAIVRSLEEDLGLNLAGAKVLILGAGGAGRTAALRLAEAGVAELYLINRTIAKAAELAREIAERTSQVRCELDYPRTAIDLILNATSLGLSIEDPLPLAQEKFNLNQAAAAYDMIYRPSETAFLKLAKAKGLRSANGAGMLLYQGAKAFEIWTGQPAPVKVMREALHRNLYPG